MVPRIASRTANNGKRWFCCPICPDAEEKGFTVDDKLVHAFFDGEDAKDDDTA